ncbi:MAG: trypsin-like peptidase domain-containing protein [Gammaproteobacteria bacterium]|nr:trypsin-like peptidase domain-containing protein [Gammaproteobacteria bacterium]
MTLGSRCAGFGLLLLALVLGGPTQASERAELVARVKPSVVGVGTTLATRRPPNQLRGTGFAVGDGRLVVTNAHVLPETFDEAHRERLAVFAGSGRGAEIRGATIVARDATHDLALLRIDGVPLPPLALGDSGTAREGDDIVFIGFPIGAVLGLYPVTHRGIISAITPLAIPAVSTRELTATRLRALDDPYTVLQLDATAYPVNSGSPVFAEDSGLVIGIVNQVLVKETKENVLKDPSAISYAIPARFIAALLAQAR